MARSISRAVFAAIAICTNLAAAQNPDSSPNVLPPLKTYKCTKSGGCVSQQNAVVIDWNYHWLHTKDYLPCNTATGLNTTLCPDAATCAKNCMIAPANYTSSGVSTSGDVLTMTQFVKDDAGKVNNASPRLYLVGPDNNYAGLQLLNQELTVTVDMGDLPCGENGALYLSQMSLTGGRNPYNTGGAAYGAGYCDAQCPVQTWKDGVLVPGGAAACCNEMDILEANSQAGAFTPHPCNAGKTDCDKGGCGWNPYAQGQRKYWAHGGTLDTSKPFTFTTQFITNDGTSSGTLTKINRKYYQNGKEIAPSVSSGDTITDSWCAANDGAAATFGGLATMGKALKDGMVLIFSIWNDNSQFMNWLDSGNSGPCSATEGNPSLIQAQNPGTHVVFSNIRWGDIGSTTGKGGSTGPGTTTTITTSVKPTKTTAAPAGPTQTQWGQCGGQGWTGPTKCAPPSVCKVQNNYYSQCQ